MLDTKSVMHSPKESVSAFSMYSCWLIIQTWWGLPKSLNKQESEITDSLGNKSLFYKWLEKAAKALLHSHMQIWQKLSIFMYLKLPKQNLSMHSYTHIHMLSCDMFNLYFGHCHAVDADRQKWGQCMHQITITWQPYSDSQIIKGFFPTVIVWHFSCFLTALTGTDTDMELVPFEAARRFWTTKVWHSNQISCARPCRLVICQRNKCWMCGKFSLGNLVPRQGLYHRGLATVSCVLWYFQFWGGTGNAPKKALHFLLVELAQVRGWCWNFKQFTIKRSK